MPAPGGSGETVAASKGAGLGAGGYLVIPGKVPHWAIVREELVISDFQTCGEH
jgi:hypothetical protein